MSDYSNDRAKREAAQDKLALIGIMCGLAIIVGAILFGITFCKSRDVEIVQIREQKYLERIEAISNAAQNGVEVRLNLDADIVVDPLNIKKLIKGE